MFTINDSISMLLEHWVGFFSFFFFLSLFYLLDYPVLRLMNMHLAAHVCEAKSHVGIKGFEMCECKYQLCQNIDSLEE